MTAGVPLDLPQTAAAPLNVDAKPITLSIKDTGDVFLGETAVRDDEIVPALRRRQGRGSRSGSSCAATARWITGASRR